MKKILYFILLVVVLMSCDSKEDNDLEIAYGSKIESMFGKHFKQHLYQCASDTLISWVNNNFLIDSAISNSGKPFICNYRLDSTICLNSFGNKLIGTMHLFYFSEDDKIDGFIVKGYKPRGSVSTAADSKHLNTWEEIYDGMRLDYKIDDIGTQAFYSSDNGCYVIRFKATNANQATPAVNLPDPDPFPYTNHGFTSGKNNLGIPEWKMPDAEISEGVIYRKNVDGSEVDYAIWDATLNKFILK